MRSVLGRLRLHARCSPLLAFTSGSFRLTAFRHGRSTTLLRIGLCLAGHAPCASNNPVFTFIGLSISLRLVPYVRTYLHSFISHSLDTSYSLDARSFLLGTIRHLIHFTFYLHCDIRWPVNGNTLALVRPDVFQLVYGPFRALGHHSIIRAKKNTIHLRKRYGICEIILK